MRGSGEATWHEQRVEVSWRIRVDERSDPHVPKGHPCVW